ncbi:hypothetical protein [Tenacibaculum sp. MAR_2009_124]|nr:hypothetical protein [Tenacibaculum sp. MAR_2009_124]
MILDSDNDGILDSVEQAVRSK